MSKARDLISLLWDQYLSQCSYARSVEDLIADNKMFRIEDFDHIAFRTFRYDHMVNVWRSLGYSVIGELDISEKSLTAVYMEHKEDPGLPFIFISQPLSHSHLVDENVSRIQNRTWNPSFIVPTSATLNGSADGIFESFFSRDHFLALPTKKEMDFLDDIGQYLTWVLFFGNRPNHFTLRVNQEAYGGIERVYNLLKAYGVPMKEGIEGIGTLLAQTSTKAVEEPIQFMDGEMGLFTAYLPYAYFEIAQRGYVMYNGFKPNQAKSLFEMTDRKG